MLRKLKKVIKFIDIFGAPIKFNIDGKDTYQSVMGGLTTLITIMLIILFFQSQIRNFATKSKIYVETSETFHADPSLLELNQDNFMFAVAIEQPLPHLYATSPFFNIVIKQNLRNRTASADATQQDPIPLAPCTLERFKKFKEEYQESIEGLFEKFQFQNFLCPLDTFKFEIEGAYLNTIFQYITIQVAPCITGSQPPELAKYWNPVCAPPEAISDYLSSNGNFRVNFYTSNYQISPHKSGGEFSQLFLSENLNFYFQPGFQVKKVNVFYNNYHVETDNSLFVTQDNTKQDFIFQDANNFREQEFQDLTQLGETNSIQELLSLSKKPSITLYLRSDNFSFQARRRFMKIDELLSYFGGIFQLFLLFFGFLMTLYNQKFFLLRLANKLYSFKEFQEQHAKDSNQNDPMIRKINTILKSSDPATDKRAEDDPQMIKNQDVKVKIEQQNKNSDIEGVKITDVTDLEKIKLMGFNSRKEFLQWYFEKILSDALKLAPTLSYVLYFLTFKKYFATQRNRLIDKAIQKVETENMNIKNLLNNVSQVDKLKQLILNNSQVILFNFFPKDELKLEDDKAQLDEKKYNLRDSVNQNDDDEQNQFNIKIILRPQSKLQTKLEFKEFQKMLFAFKEITQVKSKDESTQELNTKLIKFLGPELRQVFKLSLLVQETENNPNQLNLLEKGILNSQVKEDADVSALAKINKQPQGDDPFDDKKPSLRMANSYISVPQKK